jgi:hypothetical protein
MDEFNWFLIAIVALFFIALFLRFFIKDNYSVYKIKQCDKIDICGEVASTFYYIEHQKSLFGFKWWIVTDSNEDKDKLIADYKANTATDTVTEITENICKK